MTPRDPDAAKRQLLASAKFFGWTEEQWADRVLELQAEVNRLNACITAQSGDQRVSLGSWWNDHRLKKTEDT